MAHFFIFWYNVGNMQTKRTENLDQTLDQNSFVKPTENGDFDILEKNSRTETSNQPAVEMQFERLPSGETASVDDEKNFLEGAIDGLTKKLKGGKKKPSPIPQIRDEITVQVEKVMEAGLAEAYRELTPVQKQEFKIKGEETALQIRELLRATHIKVKKIFKLIIDWLKMLPGINRFFIEQEAKIKTDKIISLKHFDEHK